MIKTERPEKVPGGSEAFSGCDYSLVYPYPLFKLESEDRQGKMKPNQVKLNNKFNLAY